MGGGQFYNRGGIIENDNFELDRIFFIEPVIRP